jgi:hypothetical protein
MKRPRVKVSRRERDLSRSLIEGMTCERASTRVRLVGLEDLGGVREA